MIRPLAPPQAYYVLALVFYQNLVSDLCVSNIIIDGVWDPEKASLLLSSFCFAALRTSLPLLA